MFHILTVVVLSQVYTVVNSLLCTVLKTCTWRWQGINWESGINVNTPLYIKQVNNKDLPYSTGNSSSIGYLVITYTGKESEKE